MDVVWDVVGFVARAIIVFLTFAACVSVFFARARSRRTQEPNILLREVSDRWKRQARSLREALALPPQKKKRFGRKNKALQEPELEPLAARVFVLDFKGDVLATEVDSLREEVTVILGIVQAGDEVVLRLESSGGAVHGYGLAASQLARLRSRDIPLTVCVDKVAASGGYMMACVAKEIIAAPFAILGSIGVVAPVPNLNRLLTKHGVDYENFTAGRYKRTVSMLAPITDEGREKFKAELDETHHLFKRFVHEMRPKLAIDELATGEHWYGTRAVELGLADRLCTSDDYLLGKSETARVFEVLCERPRSMRERAASIAQSLANVFLSSDHQARA